MVDGTGVEVPGVRAVVVDHVSLRVRDLETSRRFYEAALAPLGFGLVSAPEGGAAFGVEAADDFWILEGDAPSTNVHVAFVARDRASVDTFHAAALGAGGRDNGTPGLRPEYHTGYYGAFVLGPDGNNIEAVYHDRAAR
jgi:catechol 2,3-dioxygenase-like lactoylglutathione lyase family enzyme